MSSRSAWSTRASFRTGSKAAEKPCLEKQNQKQKESRKVSKGHSDCKEEVGDRKKEKPALQTGGGKAYVENSKESKRGQI